MTARTKSTWYRKQKFFFRSAFRTRNRQWTEGGWGVIANRHLSVSRQPSIRVLPSLCLSPLEVSLVEFYELKCESLSDRESRKVAKGAHLLRELFGASSRVFFTGRLFTFPTREFPAVSHRVCGKKDERPTI